MDGQAVVACRQDLGQGLKMDLKQGWQKWRDAGGALAAGAVVAVAGVWRGAVLARLSSHLLMGVMAFVRCVAHHRVILRRRERAVHLGQGASERGDAEQACQDETEPVFRNLRHGIYSMAAGRIVNRSIP